MLIVGNVANNHYGGADIKSQVEVLCLEESKDRVKSTLKILGPPMDTNNVSDTYLKDGIRYIIYKSTQLPVIEKILKAQCDIPERVQFASPMTTFLWTLMKSKFIHTFINAWEENIITCSTLYNKYVKYTSTESRALARTGSVMLTAVGAMCRGTVIKNYKYRKYDTYTRASLFDLYSSGILSKYEAILLSNRKNGRNRDVLSLTNFNKYVYTVKLDAIMERLYVDTANEFLIPDMMEKRDSGVSVKVLFKTAVMNLCSQSTNAWLTEFVICNYNDIMKKFNPDCVNILYDAIGLNLLDESPVGKIY